MPASGAQSKSCRACGKKGHMSASCTVLKNKLNCNYCNLKGSHNSNPCLKKAESKQKERKFYRQDEQRGFQERSSSYKENLQQKIKELIQLHIKDLVQVLKKTFTMYVYNYINMYLNVHRCLHLILYLLKNYQNVMQNPK